MFCKECGANNRNDAKFCAECGAPMVDYTKERENLLMPEDIKNEQEINQSAKKKNKLSMVLYILSWVAFVIANTLVFCSIYVFTIPLLIIGGILEVAWLGLLIASSVLSKSAKKLKSQSTLS